MANPRQEEKFTQGMEDATRAGERAAEQTTRIGQAATDQSARVGQSAAEAGKEVAREGANLLKQNVETLQNAWRSGLETATSVMGRSTTCGALRRGRFYLFRQSGVCHCGSGAFSFGLRECFVSAFEVRLEATNRAQPSDRYIAI